MTAGELIILIISSGVVTALITSGKDIILEKIKRKNQVEDRDIETVKDIRAEINDKIDGLSEELHDYIKEHNEISNGIIRSNKLILQTKIETLATEFIHEGAITHEHRKMLHEMWHEYHYTWRGNGDLNLLMKEVDELPLK